jgi:two-component system alkaline phosphatase synthesis response regulator PhoP
MSDKKAFRVLVVDDDRDILDLLKYNLEKEGYKVKTVEDSKQALKTAKNFEPDLIILDIMMPHPNGIELCREFRSLDQFADTYIFFLTAKSENYFQEAALNTGGDDYIEKVVGLRALTYKVATVLKKRFVIRKSEIELSIGNIKINRKRNTVKIGDKEFTLSIPEFELLFFFAQNPRKEISQESLLHNIWGSEIYLFDSSVDVYIQNLAKKIGWPLIKRTDATHYRLDIQ